MAHFSEHFVTSLKDALGGWYAVIYNFVGVLSIILQFVSFQMKRRAGIITLTILNSCGWMIYFVMQGDFTSFAVGIVGIMRNVVFMLREKHTWAKSRAWLYAFLTISITVSIFTFRVWQDIFPTLASLFSIVAYYMIDENRLRKISLITFSLWIANSVSKGYVVAAVADITAMMSLLVSLYRYRKIRGKSLQETAPDPTPQIVE